MADFSSSNLPDEVVQFDSGTKQWFYQAAAPTGWTIDTTLGNAVLAVHGSSSYSGSGSGGVQAGTWTQPNHTHTVDIYASDKTGTILSHGAESITAIATDANDVSWELEAGPASYSGKGKRETTAGGATANTWRPFANVGIIASKD
jgi:hypothetical protein